jgi:negative regulator of sigma E activity
MCAEEQEKDKLALRVDLEGETLEKFRVVQDDTGTHTAAETFRVMLNEAYKRVKAKKQ